MVRSRVTAGGSFSNPEDGGGDVFTPRVVDGGEGASRGPGCLDSRRSRKCGMGNEQQTER